MTIPGLRPANVNNQRLRAYNYGDLYNLELIGHFKMRSKILQVGL